MHTDKHTIASNAINSTWYRFVFPTYRYLIWLIGWPKRHDWHTNNSRRYICACVCARLYVYLRHVYWLRYDHVLCPIKFRVHNCVKRTNDVNANSNITIHLQVLFVLRFICMRAVSFKCTPMSTWIKWCNSRAPPQLTLDVFSANIGRDEYEVRT